MKKNLMMFGAASLLAGMLIAGGCGSSDDTTTPGATTTTVPGATTTTLPPGATTTTTTVTTTTLPSGTVDASAANAVPSDASTGAVTFNVHPTTSFTYNVVNFAAGDKLVFDAGTAVGVTNVSGADGVIDVVGSLNANAVTVHLTGVAAASDAAIFGVNSFNTVFGAGSLLP